MKILNVSKKIILADNVIIAKSFSEKIKGLIGSDKPSPLFLKTRWGIHTFGMKFAIDCIVCNKSLEIKTIRENLSPWNIFFWSPEHENVFELPAGLVLKTGTEINDKLELIET